MSSLKINILNIKDLETQELGRLFQLAKIDIGQVISYMEGQRFAYEQTIRDLTIIVDHGDKWNREPAKIQRLAELEMSNAYYSVIEKLKPLDIHPKSFRRFTKTNIRDMVDQIKEDIRNEISQRMDKFDQDDDDVTADMVIAGINGFFCEILIKNGRKLNNKSIFVIFTSFCP